MHQGRGVRTANPFLTPRTVGAPQPLEEAEPCLLVPSLAQGKSCFQSLQSCSSVAGDPLRSIHTVPVGALIRVVPVYTFGTRQPLVSAVPETRNQSCSMGWSPAAVSWHGAREALFLPWCSSIQSCSCKAGGIRQLPLNALCIFWLVALPHSARDSGQYKLCLVW